ncbi:MAG: hypothetical protein JW807_07705 [Spirochaetes bacterium]|nr:hypothetical protein [Spirochaetota bacterium]
MKKFLFISALCAMVIGVAAAVNASAPDMNGNQSVEYCKTMNRQASTEPDATYFNPAGTAFMADGLYLYLSNQTAYQPITIKIRGGNWNEIPFNTAGARNFLSYGQYKGLKYAWYFPNLYLVYKKDRWAVSFGGYPLGGGGDGKFDKGLQMIDVLLNADPMIGLGNDISSLYNSLGLGVPIVPGIIKSKFTGSSMVITAQANFAYQVIEDKLSIAIGYRFIMGDATYDASIFNIGIDALGTYNGYIPLGSNLHAEQRGYAHGLIGSICVKPVKDLTVAIRGEWNSPLNLKTKSKDYLIAGAVDSSFMNGGRKAMQMAASLAFGLAYVWEGLQISPSFIYHFNQFAQWKQKEKNYTGGYDVGIGLDYTFKNVPLNIGVGYLYAFTGCRPSAQSQMGEDLNASHLGFGFSVNITENIKLTLGEIISFYTPTDVNAGQTSQLKFLPARFYKDSYDTGIGITAKVL